MCFVFIWEQTATCATYSINWLVFTTEMKSVYSAVRTGSLNKAVCASSLKKLTKFEFSWEIYENNPNIKFHENPSSASRVVTYIQTDGRTNRQTWRSRFLQFRVQFYRNMFRLMYQTYQMYQDVIRLERHQREVVTHTTLIPLHRPSISWHSFISIQPLGRF